MTLKNSLMLPDQAVPYEQLAETLKLSQNGVKTAVFRMRKRFRELFRASVSQLVDDPTDVDDEVRYLMTAILHQSDDS